ncbi:MAG: tRNA (guanosine(46)-N7)-methyltransferase TrmB [Alphaproteobacteria bacterium]|nr:tRNA (guanosine(46)-N7)-methyltransferase TrmB [Alphaproteobacteria bacterium]
MNSENVKFFGRRKGRKIRKAKTSLLERFLPLIKLPEHSLISKDMFSQPVERLSLEIGFGGGEHLAGVSSQNPSTGYIGAEVFQNGIANLLSLITGIKQNADLPEVIRPLPHRADNVRIFDDDVRLLFPRLPNGCLDEVFLLFPDPWPKKRHADRRFINPANLDELSRILASGGRLLIATDHPVYKSWVIRQMRTRPDFVWTAKCFSDWRYPPADWVATKYQKKALSEGRRPVFFEYRRL